MDRIGAKDQGKAEPIISALIQYAELYAESNSEPAEGDCRKTIEQARRFVTPKVPSAVLRYEALGDSAPHRMFHAEPIGRAYGLTWRHFQDEAARETLNALGLSTGNIRRFGPGENRHATSLGCDVRTCLITPATYQALRHEGVVSTKLLLD